MAVTHTYEVDSSTVSGGAVWDAVTITVPNPCGKLYVTTGLEDNAGTIGAITGIDVGGQAMTRCNDGTTDAATNSNASGADLQRTEGWYLDNPPTGSQTLQVTGTGPSSSIAHVVSYYINGAAAGQPEAVAVLASSADPSVLSITTLTANALVIGSANAGAAVTISGVGTDETLECNQSAGGSRHGTASEIKTSSGSNSITFDWSAGPARVAGVVVAFAEAAGAGGGGGAYYRKRRSHDTGGRGL